MNDELLNGSVFKSLMLFAIPFMLSNLLQVLYGAADLFVVGHFATTSDVSAVSIGSQTMAMLTNLILGFTTGITVLLGQFFGAKKEKEFETINFESMDDEKLARLKEQIQKIESERKGECVNG